MNMSFSNMQASNSRITERLDSSLYKWIDYTGDVYIFVRDMYQGIMPYPRQSQLKVALKKNDGDLERLLAGAMDSGQHDLSHALSNFIRSAAHTLFFFGSAAYEVEYKRDESGRLTELSLDYVHPLSIFKIFGRFYQFIPWHKTHEGWTRPSVHRIPEGKLLYVSFPKTLGGKIKIRKILKRLAFFSKEVFPDFQLKAMEKNDADTGFDFEKYKLDQYVEKASLTKNLGWNQSRFNDELILEYYSLYRYLKFAISQAVVREHVIAALNSVLNGSYLNLDNQIEMSGIHTAEQLRKDLAKLSVGGVPFEVFYKKVRFR